MIEHVKQTLQDILFEKFPMNESQRCAFIMWFEQHVQIEESRMSAVDFYYALQNIKDLTGVNIDAQDVNELWRRWNSELLEHNIFLIVAKESKVQARSGRKIIIIDLNA